MPVARADGLGDGSTDICCLVTCIGGGCGRRLAMKRYLSTRKGTGADSGVECVKCYCGSQHDERGIGQRDTEP